MWVVRLHKKLRHTECAYYFARQDAAPTMGMDVSGASFGEYLGNVRVEMAPGYDVQRGVLRLRKWLRHTDNIEKTEF